MAFYLSYRKSKRSFRVQSAPPAKFKPTEIKPFGMTLREEVKAKEKAILQEMLKKPNNDGKSGQVLSRYSLSLTNKKHVHISVYK